MREYVEKQLHTRVDCEPNDASEITTQNSFRKCRSAKWRLMHTMTFILI